MYIVDTDLSKEPYGVLIAIHFYSNVLSAAKSGPGLGPKIIVNFPQKNV